MFHFRDLDSFLLLDHFLKEFGSFSHEMFKRLYKDTDNPDLSTSMNNIGLIYVSMGKYELAYLLLYIYAY